MSKVEFLNRMHFIHFSLSLINLTKATRKTMKDGVSWFSARKDPRFDNQNKVGSYFRLFSRLYVIGCYRVISTHQVLANQRASLCSLGFVFAVRGVHFRRGSNLCITSGELHSLINRSVLWLREVRSTKVFHSNYYWNLQLYLY